MTEQTISTGPEAAPLGAPAYSEMTVEFVIDGYRVTGELRSPGAPRRLVDILNVTDDPSVIVRKGALDDPLIEDDEPRHFDTVLVHREAILFAVPREQADLPHNTYDVVEKAPVQATVHVPGFEITGNVHLLKGVDPEESNLLGSRHFIPMTDVTVRAGSLSDARWQEPIIVVNFAQVRTFAPQTG